MKLYLSSYRIPTPQDLEKLLAKSFFDCQTAIIPNAKDDKLPQERAQKLDELYVDLAKLGIKADVVDLREYDSAEQLKKVLLSYDLLWIAGGNTYVIRSEMQRSGFDAVIRDVLAAGCVYGGESAGAIVAGQSLKGFEIADDPDEAEMPLWDGLGLLEKIIAPHMDNPDFTEYVNHIKKIYAGDERVVYLNDSQALVVDGSEQRVVTAA